MQDHSFYADDLAHIDFAKHARKFASKTLLAAERVIARRVIAMPGFITSVYMRLRNQRHAASDEGSLRHVVIEMEDLVIRAGGQTTDAAAQAGLRR